jgi:cyclase
MVECRWALGGLEAMRVPSVVRTVVLALPLLARPQGAAAHSGAPPATPSEAAGSPAAAPEFKVEKLSERAYCLYGRGGNVGFLVTEGGVLVVDDEFEDVAPAIVQEIAKITDRPIRYLVNTHYHPDHTGGNRVFARFAEILAHQNVRTRMMEMPGIVRASFPGRIQAIESEISGLKDPADPYRLALQADLDLFNYILETFRTTPEEAIVPPRITFEGRMDLWLAEQPIEIYHFAPGHTDGDAIVFFRNEKVLHMGDLFVNGMYPFIDALGGGSEKGFIDNLDAVLARVPADTRVIPGHGQATDLSALRHFRDFLSDLRRAVQAAFKKGLSRVEAVRTIRMEQYPDLKARSRTLGNDIAATYDEVKAGR